MADDSFTEVTSESWFSRIGGAIKGVLFGLLLFVVSFPLLFWNEGRAVRTYKTLAEGAKSVVAVSADKVEAANDGRLVHVSGKAVTTNTVQDAEFAVSATGALQLRRKVEMFQWQETSESSTEKNLGGSTTTTKTYKYNKVWSENPINSSGFKKGEGHVNPAAVSYTTRLFLADGVTLGAFRLTSSLVAKINAPTALVLTTNTPLPALLGTKGQRTADGFYVGADPATPQIGDVRVRFAVVNATEVSVISRQVGGSFEPYITHTTGKTIEMLKIGAVSAELMFQQAEDANKVLTWILRLVGFIVMLIGVNMVLRPLAVLADVLPFLGDLMEFGLGLIAFVIAAPLTLLTISIAWISYRPLFGLALIAVAAGVVYLVRRHIQKKKAAAPPANV